ncbi:MAG: tRNA uridine-5-carboxymethylaminomethyl(34) synthesis GTPase MnmE [Desulfitobacteriaceae bacterium]|nr:tRNA uridine-5-carboxymethylaminomethyl(34) synthesis GTPase MnmE [Desulfitobacteriaceae bacterium]MDD4751881.1 tRNA uridine-5-carboxymethylaminomethyl(34) synthesis GTPase MnmE [Desulfitobacteriaceae bacterium]
MLSDTIAAISTPLGEGGIGIVRISGKEALKVMKKIFHSKNPKDWNHVKSQTMHLGYVVDFEGNIIDEVLVSIMREPKTFTGEDIVEINCHGGLIPLKKTLELTLQAGARMADRGEFTKRAFLNGRIDLSQAEGIIDIIRAKTDAGLKAALGQMEGSLSRKIKEIQNSILGVLAIIEAGIDFPEDEVEEISTSKVQETIKEVYEETEKMIKSAERGKIIREGINTVIVGRTNVGKSSLLNALLGEKRAIVTNVPGTTRDTIEEFINVGGFPLKIVDTAGIRETEDVVEKIGVEKSRELLENADLVLLVLDITAGISQDEMDLINSEKAKNIIVLINKIDVKESQAEKQRFEKVVEGIPHLFISAQEEIGIGELEKMIEQLITDRGVESTGDFFITNIRHKNCLVRTKEHLNEVINGIKLGVSLDIVSIDVRSAWESLGEITGETVGEELLDRIFSDFCIGK